MSVDSVKAVSTYTDEWIDDTNPSAGEVVGCGVTYAEYYDDYHLVAVSTTITSPNGRSAIEYGYGDGAQFKRPNIARAEALLAWDWNDAEGNFTVSSHHWSDCPLEDLGTTSGTLVLGISVSCYRYAGTSAGGVYRYDIVAGCAARTACPEDSIAATFFATFATKAEAFTVVEGETICAGIETIVEAPNGCTSQDCKNLRGTPVP